MDSEDDTRAPWSADLHLTVLSFAQREVNRAEANLAERQDDLRAAVRAALDSNVSADHLAKALGVSRQWIYKLGQPPQWTTEDGSPMGSPVRHGASIRPSQAVRKRRAYSIHEVAEMLNEPAETIAKHCRTQALQGAYKTGGKTSPWRIPPQAIDHYQATRSNR